MSKLSSNSYAVITGASSGIGREFARILAAEGFSLILIARRLDMLCALKEELSSIIAPDSICITYKMDVSDFSACDEFMEYMQDQKIGVFINNAGFGDCSYFPDGDLQKEMSMIDVNVKAVHYLTKLMVRKMLAQKGGYILNVASSAGLLPAGPYMATYYATKSYVTSMTMAIARELKEHGSNVYIGCLCPGPVDTEFNSVANVEFALPGINARDCALYAVKQMKRRVTVIIPTARMKLAILMGRLSPLSLSTAVTGMQQKKKMGR